MAPPCTPTARRQNTNPRPWLLRPPPLPLSTRMYFSKMLWRYATGAVPFVADPISTAGSGRRSIVAAAPPSGSSRAGARTCRRCRSGSRRMRRTRSRSAAQGRTPGRRQLSRCSLSSIRRPISDADLAEQPGQLELGTCGTSAPSSLRLTSSRFITRRTIACDARSTSPSDSRSSDPQRLPAQHVLHVREDARQRVLEIVDDERGQLLLLPVRRRGRVPLLRITS